MEKYYKKILAEKMLIKNSGCKTSYLPIPLRRILIFLILIIFQSNSYAQQWRVFTTANSPLPTNAIGTIVIDTNNIKWIGSGFSSRGGRLLL